MKTLPPLNCAWCGQFIHDGHSPVCVMDRETGREVVLADGSNLIVCQRCDKRGGPPRKRAQQAASPAPESGDDA